MKQKSLLTSGGALGAAILGSACCWLPLLLLTLGAGATVAGRVTSAIEKFRPAFAVGAIAMTGAALYLTYFRRPTASPAGCCALSTDGRVRKERLSTGVTLDPRHLGDPCAPTSAPDKSHVECCAPPRASGPTSKLADRLGRVNRILLPILSVLILAMIFFPHQLFGFLVKKDSATPGPSTVDPSSKVVVLSVPGMT